MIFLSHTRNTSSLCGSHRRFFLSPPVPPQPSSPTPDVFFFLNFIKMSGRRGILGLPDAVLRQICTQFCPHCGGEDCLGGCELPDSFWGPEYFGTLAALAQVNVRLGRQAQAVRLHVFCGRRDSLPLLARTLAEHPGLAAHICVVRLGDRDRDAGHGGILGELATPGNIDSLAALVAPSVGNNALFTGASGDQQLLAPFMQLPAIEETFLCAPGGEEMPADTPEAMVSQAADGPPTPTVHSHNIIPYGPR